MSDRPAGQGKRRARGAAAASGRPRTARRWPWVLLGSGLLLGGVVAYSPTLFGGLLLARLGGSGVQAGRVSGPLWAPRVEGARVQLPGVTATAGAAGVTVTGVDAAARTVRVAVAVEGANVDLKLAELLKGVAGGGSGGAAGGGWKVVVSGVDIRDSRLRLDGQGVNVPNLRVKVDQGEGGRLKVEGATDDGDFTAGVTVAETAAGANRFTVDVDADARIARHYWKGIEAGRITGRYVVGDGDLRGDLRLSGGELRVPEARFVRVTGVTGRATHRGEQIGFTLAGQGWDGPVTARGGVDLKAQNWTVSADATPTVAGLARAVGTSGQGTLKLRVTAGGWTTVRVKGYAQGEGTVAGVPFEAAKGEYTFLSADSAKGDGQTNDLAFSARTRVAGAQTLTGRWALGRAGTAAWKGDFAGRPLDLTAGINARNVVTLDGTALGGPLDARYALKGGALTATLNPDYGAARARVTLGGTAEDLRATVTGGQAGPLALSGSARYDRSGLRAAVNQPGGGTVQLDLDRQLRGTWAVRNLSGAGVTLGGSGTLNLTGGTLSGDVSAQVPGLEKTLGGPLNLDFIKRRATFRSGEQALAWNGETFSLRARDLAVTGGAAVSGDLSVNTRLEAVGTLRAEGNGYDLRAEASGTTARVRGTAGGVTVLADADLRAPYRTTARIEGTDIRGSLSVQNGVRFSLTTLGDTASGLIDGADWRATGRVNLAALRPLLPTVAGLGGTVDLNLAGLGGTAQVRAQAAGATVAGTLTRRGDIGRLAGGQSPIGTVTADLRAALPLGGDSAGATLTGRVYPDVQASGAATFMGQTLRATVSGPYGALAARLSGRTGALAFGGVSVPAQDIDVTATLTPALSASGRWGDLGVTYDGRNGLVRVAGTQTLSAFGRTGQVQGRATWGPGSGSSGSGAFRGAVEARGTLDGYTVALSGPWDRLNVLATNGEGLRAEGRASLPAGTYDLSVNGPLTVPGAGGDGRLLVDGNIRGTGARPSGTLSVRDSAGGAATVTLRGLNDLQVDARRLTLAGQILDGRLSAAGGVLSGRLRAGPLDVVAAGGRLSASGTVAGQTVRASGRLTLPATVSDLNLRVDGPYLSARATGDLSNLSGTVELRAQRFGSGTAALVVPAQTLPLSGSLTGARVNLGGLTYAGGAWAGRLGLRYRLESAAGTQPGTLAVAGDGPRLSVLPSGPLGGRVQVLPSIGGTLTADLAPFMGLLPENLRAVIRPGQLVAEVRATGADVSLRRTQYAGAPLGLDAQLDWRGGVGTQGIVAQGVLTHPGTRLPVRLAGGTLSVSGGRLDARALAPLLADAGLPGVTGAATLDLNVPELEFAQASGTLGVDLRASGGEAQDVRGRVTLRGGQLAADLAGTVSGISATVRGPVYPQADAALTVRAQAADGPRLSAGLRGSAAETLTLTATGAYAGRALTLNASGQGLTTGAARATVRAATSGATLDLGLTRGAGDGLGAWRVAGQLAAPDLGPLAGVQGALSATLGGTLADLRAQASGEAAGARFTVPARYTDGILRLQGATATLTGTALAGTTLRASGPVYPTLALSARADVNKVVPGRFTAQVGGALAKPDVNVQGLLTGAVGGENGEGLAVAGTRLSARLLGQDWKVALSGDAVNGPLRGRLGTAAPGGLLNARLNLNTRYRSGETDVALTGATGWNARAGWLGTLRAVGTVPGGALNAALNGGGTLALSGTLGGGAKQASFSGALGADLPLRPAGTLTLNRLDAGAFWGRPGQLGVGGTLRLGGAAWNRVEATFAGRTEDTLGELSGDVQASYRAGDVALSLSGPALSGAATLRAGRYDATLKTPSLRLARLLPATLDVDALTFAGTAEAHGTLAGGPESFSARNLALRGEQGQVGPFSLYGSAEYRPQGEVLKADLRGSLRGGLLSAQGSLPQGLNLRVSGVPTAYKGAASFGTGPGGSGKVDAALTLAGQVRDPTVSGTLNAVTDALAARLTLSGRTSDPHLLARAELRGQGQGGTLYADIQDLDLAAGTARTSVYGSVQASGNRADVKLQGQWPQLSGTVQAKLGALADPLTLRGDGRGGYALDAGRLGGGDVTLTRTQGFIPTLAGRLDLTPLGLVAGSSGRATVAATLGGTVATPTLAATVTTTGAAVSGVSLADLTGTLSGSIKGLSGVLSQGGAEVASLSGQTLTLRDFALEAAGSRVRASGTAGLNGVADLALTAAGNVSGNLKASYRAQALAVQGSVSAQGLNANLNVNADPYTGWHGTARVTGGPQGVLTGPADLALSGPFARPLLTGTAGLLGAGARLVADARGVQLRLVDGPGATASGAVELRPDEVGQWRWLGATSLSRPELSLSVTPSGPLADPRLVLSLRRGDWRAAGTASRAAADLSVSDGAASGRVTWDGEQVTADLPGLDLARLDVGGLSGRVTANGSVSSRTRDGALTFRIAGVSAPQDVPYLGLPLTGDVSGDLRLEAGRPRVQATAALSAGTLNLAAAQSVAGPWTGTLAGQLRKDAGILDVNVRAAETGLTGSVGVTSYPVEISGQTLTVGGQIGLTGQGFTGNLRAGNAMGSAQLTAEGGLADLVPALGNVLAVKPTGEGYSARAILNEVKLGDLGLLPGLDGQVSGEANLNDGGGTFFVQSPGLKLGTQTEAARVEGTQVAGNWRLRGYLGRTQFTAGLGGGEVFGQATLQALPLGALVGAATGTTPGEGVVTGIARFRLPLANPAAGSATVVAERIRVSASTTAAEAAAIAQANAAAAPAAAVAAAPLTPATTPATSPAPGTTVDTASGIRTETLVGSGTLDYAAGELRNVDIQLSGAGTWNVRGQYTRQKVDLSAQFSGTTFTPVLRLIPGLAELQPSLRGTLTLSAAGTYDRPRGLLRAQNLSGSVAGLSVQVPEFAGDLPDSGAFTGGGRVLTGGTVGTDGRVDLKGQLTLGRLSGTQVTFSGLVAPEVLGALPNTTVTLSQQSAGAGQPERWTIAGQSASTNPTTGAGTLALSGTLSPLDLSLAARNYNLPLAVIYGRESALTGDLRAVTEGQLIRVSGAADFARLTLGRVNAPTTIPGPGESAATNTDGRTTDNFASPLPEQYTTFPQPQQEGEEEQTPQRPFLERLILDDLRVTAPNGIRVDENLARAEFGTTGLTISGTGARPRIRGEILAQRGSLFLRENEFTITEGRVGFSGEGLYPTFNITARGTVPGTVTVDGRSVQQQVPIVLSVAGDFRTVAGRPNVLNLTTTLSCAENSGAACVNPATGAAYGEPELYALVVTGVPDLASLPSNLGTLGASALRTALNVFVLGEIERTLARALGLDVFRLTPTLSTAGDVNATITVGSYLTRELFLQYQTDLSGNGLVDASYSTPDGRFTFRVSTPLTGLNLESIRPNFSADYNVNRRTSLSLGVTTTASTGSDPESTRVRFGVTYRFGVR